MRLSKAFALAGLLIAMSSVAAPDPAATNTALIALLGVSDRPIDKRSSCFGNYGQKGAPKVKDLLASRLAYLYNGQNVIEGVCQSDRCELEVRHSAGEDVSSLKIVFGLQRGAARMEGMQCLMTP